MVLVSENHSAVKDGYSQEMGGTGREGASASLKWKKFSRMVDRMNIGHGYCGIRDTTRCNQHDNEYHDFNVVVVSVQDRDRIWGCVTEKVVDYIELQKCNLFMQSTLTKESVKPIK